jgi:hypothetical protein
MKLTPDAKGAEAARRYIAELMRKATGGSIVFDAYVRDDLAGDFAWNLANHLLAAPAPLSDEPVAKPVCWITREQLQKVEDESEDTWVYWAETGHAAEPDEVPLFTHSESDMRRAALEETYQAAMSCDGALNNAGAVAMKIRALISAPPATPSDKQVIYDAIEGAMQQGFDAGKFFGELSVNPSDKQEALTSEQIADLASNYCIGGQYRDIVAFGKAVLSGAALAQSAEQDRIDAERYRWMRRTFINDDESWPDDVAFATTEEKLDVAIDAAKGASK